MNFNLLGQHHRLIIFTVSMILCTFVTTFSLGQLKDVSTYDFADVLGEGGIAAVTLMWITVILMSRPAGQLTNYLVVGLVFMHISVLADFLDEFLFYPPEQLWITAYESIPAPIGMLLTTFGLYQWHKEQVSINQQLKKREQSFREHQSIDFITGLYNGQFMEAQIERMIERTGTKKINTNNQLLMLDIDQFDDFVRLNGDPAADRVLRELSELFLMNLRPIDLLCRYAGDRFIALLPNLTSVQLNAVTQQLEQAIASYSIKPASSVAATYLSFSFSHCSSKEFESAQSAFELLNNRMVQQKQNRLRVA